MTTLGRIKKMIICGMFALIVSCGPAHATALKVDVVTDGIVLGSSLVFAAASEVLLPMLPPVTTLGSADVSEVNNLDKALLYPYSAGLDFTSTILEYTTAALPGILGFFVPTEDIIPLGVVYLESLSFAVGAKNILKYLLPRYRPYVYRDGAGGVSASEDDQSFPSGHATVAFAAAAAGVSLFAASFPDSPYFWPFTASCYGLAVLTASFRVASGMHFLTDVMAGAAVGSLCGFLIPLLHEKKPVEEGTTGLSFEVTPSGMLIRCTY